MQDRRTFAATDSGRDRVVLVGHKWADADLLSSAVRRALPDVTVRRANTESELLAELPRVRALLVSLTLYGKFADASGPDLVERLRTTELSGSEPDVTMMIVGGAAEPETTADATDTASSDDAIAGEAEAVTRALVELFA